MVKTNDKTKEIKNEIVDILKKRLSAGQTRAFMFGSSIKKDIFFDIDIGVMGKIDLGELALLKFDFEQSNFPYKVDLVDFNKVNHKFKDQVFQDEVIWLNL